MRVSIIVPTIRPNYWQRFYDSVVLSCKNFSWEIIFVGPFANEEFLKSHPDVRFIESFANPTTCFQVGVAASENPIYFFSSDDSVLYPDALDTCLSDWIQHCRTQDVINCRYREGNNFGTYEFPMAYWFAGSYPHVYGQKYVKPQWGIALQTVGSREFFIEFGGFDCAFQFSNHAHADFSFRLQNGYGHVYQSRVEIANLSHFDGDDGDHAPVRSAQENDDTKLFNEIWNNQDGRGKIDFNNYKSFASLVWNKRFKQKYTSYKEMCQGENHNEIIG
jgi:hypothetical protein